LNFVSLEVDRKRRTGCCGVHRFFQTIQQRLTTTININAALFVVIRELRVVDLPRLLGVSTATSFFRFEYHCRYDRADIVVNPPEFVAETIRVTPDVAGETIAEMENPANQVSPDSVLQSSVAVPLRAVLYHSQLGLDYDPVCSLGRGSIHLHSLSQGVYSGTAASPYWLRKVVQCRPVLFSNSFGSSEALLERRLDSLRL